MDHQVSMRESGHESVRHAKAPHLRRLEVRDALVHTSEQHPTIRPVTSSERGAALHVINTAAEWYREFLRSEEHRPTEMDEAGWDGETQRLTWWGAYLDGLLVGVMGCEPAGDAVLMRHAYVLPRYQRIGIGTKLLNHLEGALPVPVRILIGTYLANYKARGQLERAGYLLSDDSESILRTYFDVPEDRLQKSIVYEKVLTG